MLKIIFCIIGTFAVVRANFENYYGEEYINALNSEDLPWKAGKNFDDEISFENIERLAGADRHDDFEPKMIEYDINESELPETLDLRKKWPNCTSIGKVYDQGNCKSSWAIGPVTAFTDTVCITTKGAKNKSLSFGHVLSCCKLCGRGCKGGWDDSAWHFFQKHGLVTGGEYGSSEGCHPYPIPPCDRSKHNSVTGCTAKVPVPTPKCRVKCSNENYKTPFKKDLVKAKDLLGVPSKSVYYAKYVLENKGVIATIFPVYSDLLNYKKGVYVKSAKAKFIGYHVVKVIGYGKFNDMDYWLVVNSWGKKWGENGLFKISILKNGVDFEDKFTYASYRP